MFNRKRLTQLTAGLMVAAPAYLVLGGSAHAQAQQQTPPQQTQQPTDQQIRQVFRQADADGDQKLSVQEANQVQGLDKQEFQRIDRDGNQMLSWEEFQAGAKDSEAIARAAAGQQEGAEIVVREQAPQVQVQTEEPKVIVKQPEPEVKVIQPEPQVSVQQPKPQVQVEEAEPQVTVRELGQPQVEIERSGQAEVQVLTPEQKQARQQTEGEQQQARQQTEGEQLQARQPTEGEQQQQAQVQPQQDQQLMQLTASELQGQQVINQQGQELGEIEKIVRQRQQGDLAAVLSVGGWLGLGEKQVAIPINELRVQEDRIVADIAMDENELERRGTYDEQQYEDVQSPDQQLAQLMQAGGGQQVSFESLDQDGDGMISAQEAQQHPQLSRQFPQLDVDQDQNLERGEFARFEPRQQQPGGTGQTQ